MKNRKIPSYDNLVLTKSPNDSIVVRTRNKKQSFLKRSAELLQSYKAVLNKPTGHNIGDADTHFKHSLRNYDDFEIAQTFKWGQQVLSRNKSLESLKAFQRNSTPLFTTQFESTPRKPKHRPKGLSAKPSLIKKVSSAQITQEEEPTVLEEPAELEAPEELEEAEEFEDPDIFYSPTSQNSEQPPSETKMAEDDELKNIEDMVKQAGSTLDEVIAENPSLREAIEGGEDSEYIETSEALTTDIPLDDTTTDTEKLVTESEPGTGTDEEPSSKGDGKTPLPYDPNIDAAVIRELEEAERQAKETAKIIYELKERVAQLLSTQTMTESEAKELEVKNRELRQQMSLFETKTKRIQFLIDQANLFENMMSPRPPLPTVQKKHNEDMLPKVIICGVTENNMPKIIVCDDKKQRRPSSSRGSDRGAGGQYGLPPPVDVMPQFAKRLSDSYYMQERLAVENADLEGKRYRLQEDLLDKDQTVESLQQKLNSLQGEMRMICKENCLLTEKLERIESSNRGDFDEPYKKQKKQKMPCGKGKPCPADVESRLKEYSETTQQLEKQLSEMENEVRSMQTELVSVQKERQHLEQHRRMLCQPPCPPPPCMPPPCPPPPCPPPICPAPCHQPPPCQGPCNPMSSGSDQQLRELREQYNRLQDDYKNKLTEVGGLRADIEKFKQIAKDAEEFKKTAEDKVKEMEKLVKSYQSDRDKFAGSKEQLVEQEQQLNVAKQRFREAQDELEELRALIQDQQAQLDDYRNKYLQAQQQVEEQRRQIDMMEMENNRIGEQVNLEIQRVKNQFQEKLQELTPLPDILKGTQLKLQEAQQMHLLAERNNEALVRELQAYRDKAAAMADQMERVRSDNQLGADEKAQMMQRQQELENKCNELECSNDQLKQDLARMEEAAEQNEKRVQEKLHEIAQLVAQLETVREESARQVARTKDRCETVRRSMQNQIADLERQLAQSRAQARSAQKDRDDIRQKMQAQINNLNENFEDAQMRIRNLQGHVNFLKNSYTNVFPNDATMIEGMEGCDCGSPF